MKTAILDYIRERPTATFANLTEAIHEFDGALAMAHAQFPNVILWPALSQNAIDALNALMAEGEIVMTGASQLSYFMDGKRPALPVATGLKAYKSPRWLPVCFSAKQDAEAAMKQQSRHGKIRR